MGVLDGFRFRGLTASTGLAGSEVGVDSVVVKGFI